VSDLLDLTLWNPSMDEVLLPRSHRLTRSQARYAGYKLIDQDGVGVGAFYPDDFEIGVTWMRHVAGYDPYIHEFSHEPCDEGDPDGSEFWAIAYVPKKREWRDGAWRRIREAAA
jgi:hypothetical protein